MYFGRKNPPICGRYEVSRRRKEKETPRVSCYQKAVSFKLVFQFLSVWAETLHDNRPSYFQQSYVFGFLILTVFGEVLDIYVFPGLTKVLLDECCYLKWRVLCVITVILIKAVQET